MKEVFILPLTINFIVNVCICKIYAQNNNNNNSNNTTTAAVSYATSCGKLFCETSSNYPNINPAILEKSFGRGGGGGSGQSSASKTSSSSSAFDNGDLKDDAFPRAPYYYPPVAGASNNVAPAVDCTTLLQARESLQICPTLFETIHPQEAINVRGVSRFIVNIGKLQQSVRLERCAPAVEGRTCDFVGTPPGVTSRCEQRFAVQRLATLIVDDESGRIETGTDQFQFPIACECRLLLLAIGGNNAVAPLPPPPPPLSLPPLLIHQQQQQQFSVPPENPPPPPPERQSFILPLLDDNRIGRQQYARSVIEQHTTTRGTFEQPLPLSPTTRDSSFVSPSSFLSSSAFMTVRPPPSLSSFSWRDQSLVPPGRFSDDGQPAKSSSSASQSSLSRQRKSF